MAKEAVAMEKKAFKFTSADVDAFAVKVAKNDAEADEISETKKHLRKQIGEGKSLPGTAFVIEISDAPPKYGKLDYRALVLLYMKKAGVDKPAAELKKMEVEAEEEVVDYSTPRVSIKANPDYVPE